MIFSSSELKDHLMNENTLCSFLLRTSPSAYRYLSLSNRKWINNSIKIIKYKPWMTSIISTSEMTINTTLISGIEDTHLLNIYLVLSTVLRTQWALSYVVPIIQWGWWYCFHFVYEETSGKFNYYPTLPFIITV